MEQIFDKTTKDDVFKWCDLSYPIFPRGRNKIFRRRLQEQRTSLGTCLAMKRLQRNAKLRADRYQDGSGVVYRRTENWDSSQAFVSCTFLDNHSTVLALDACGRFDIIRLPSFGHTEKARELGSCLLSKIDLFPSLGGSDLLKIKRVRESGIFCVGLPSGKYRTVHIDHVSLSANKQGDDTSRRSRSPQNQSNMVVEQSTFQGPSRIYPRDRTTTGLSLWDMFQRMKGADENLLYTPATQDFELQSEYVAPPVYMDRFNVRRFNLTSARWDFLTTASTIMACHVDEGSDCYWLNVADHRLNSLMKPVICIDATTKDRAPSMEENITSCAFLSDYCLVTSHVLTTRALSDLTKPITANCIKLWDIRKTSSIQNTTGALNETVLLHSFPDHACFSQRPMSSHQIDSSKMGDGSSNAKGNEGMVVSELHPTGQGKVVATALSRNNQNSCCHVVLDVHKQETSSSFTQNVGEGQSRPLFATAITSDSMILVEELAEEPTSLNMISLNNNNNNTSALGKRKHYSKNIATSHAETEVSKFYPKLIDKYGLDTRLSSVATNDIGTCIVGGSIDGDIFAWRAS